MSLLQRFRTWRMRRRLAAEVAAMDSRALADLGQTRSELLNFLHYPADIRSRMARMARVFGADITRLERVRGAWAEAAHACGTCCFRDACARELDAAATTAARCGFCPNADTWRDMAGERASRAA